MVKKKKKKLPSRKVAIVVSAVLIVLVGAGIAAVLSRDPILESSNSYEYVPLKVNVTANVEDLPESLRPLAYKAEAAIIDKVGNSIYTEHYRIALDRSIECAEAAANSGQCVAFLYLPPSKYGLSDRFIFARYTDRQFRLTGNITNCLDDAQSCLFNVNQEEALDMLKKSGLNIESDDLRIKGLTTHGVWWWETHSHSSSQSEDPLCFKVTVHKVYVSNGSYTKGTEESCQ